MSKEIQGLRNITNRINTFENLSNKRTRQYAGFEKVAVQTDDLDEVTRLGMAMDITSARKDKIEKIIRGLRIEFDEQRTTFEANLEQLSELAARHPTLTPALERHRGLYGAFLNEIKPKQELPTDNQTPKILVIEAAKTGANIDVQTEPSEKHKDQESEKPSEYSVVLDSEQTLILKSERAARILQLLLEAPRNTQDLGIELFGEYNIKTIHQTFQGIRTLRNNLVLRGYDVITKTTPGERGRGKKAVYELIKLQKPSEPEKDTKTDDASVSTTSLEIPVQTEEISQSNNLTDYETVVIKNALRNTDVIDALNEAQIPLLTENISGQIDDVAIIINKKVLTSDVRKEIIRKIEVICKEGITDLVFDNSKEAARLLLTYLTELDKNQELVLGLLYDYFSEEIEHEGTADRDGWVQSFRRRLTERQSVALDIVKRKHNNTTSIVTMSSLQTTELAPKTPGHTDEITKSVDSLSAREQPDTGSPTPREIETQVVMNYHNLQKREPDALIDIHGVVSQIFSEIPELMADPTTCISPGRVTQIFNNVTQSFTTNLEEKRVITPPVSKGKKVYGVLEIAMLVYLKHKSSIDHLDQRSLKELRKAVAEEISKQTDEILKRKSSNNHQTEK